jgi:hypothetical protein
VSSAGGRVLRAGGASLPADFATNTTFDFIEFQRR